MIVALIDIDAAWQEAIAENMRLRVALADVARRIRLVLARSEPGGSELESVRVGLGSILRDVDLDIQMSHPLEHPESRP
jgi:hypothetical protein